MDTETITKLNASQSMVISLLGGTLIFCDKISKQLESNFFLFDFLSVSVIPLEKNE